ncbi:hypothetical protein V1511DRAFT_506614 [Dipodascopsis uninucleata]
MVVKREFPTGIYVPVLTFYDSNDEVDVETCAKHAVRLAEAGMTGIVTLGSFGEGVLLSPEERVAVNRAIREALDNAGFTDVVLIAGVTEQSVRGAIKLAKDAADVGADAILMVSTSYFRSAVNDTVIEDFFTGVADESPIPIIIYNFPGVTGGIDITSDLIIKLASHPNIIGTKFTCGNSGKLARVANALPTVSPLTPDVKVSNGGYLAIAGMSDFLFQALSVGGTGVISGPANLVPKTVLRIYTLFAQGKYLEAMEAQKKLSEIDYVLTNLGPEGTKLALQKYHGYGGHVRRPLTRKVNIEDINTVAEICDKYMKIEASL